MHYSTATLLAVVVTAAIGFANSTCIKDGASAEVATIRPASPPSGTWTSTDPKMKEDDSTSPDDEMGDATTDSSGVTKGQVSNTNGDLSGPNGEDQNGVTEGNCIEVKFCWEYTVWVAGHYGFYVAGDEIRWGWIPGYSELLWSCSTPPQEVCPCGWSPCIGDHACQ